MEQAEEDAEERILPEWNRLRRCLLQTGR